MIQSTTKGDTHEETISGAACGQKAVKLKTTVKVSSKVSSDGRITAKSVGTATIYIQDIGGRDCKTKVEVTAK